MTTFTLYFLLLRVKKDTEKLASTVVYKASNEEYQLSVVSYEQAVEAALQVAF